MLREPPEVLDLSNPSTRRRIMQKIGTLTGLYEITLKPRKRTRSLSQNAYYFVAVCQPFRDWLREEWQESVTTEQAHEMLKRKILGVKELVDKKTGEVLEITPTSHGLDTLEFSEYIEGCARWLAEFCNVVVIPSDLFWESPSKPKNVLKYKPKSELRRQLEGSVELLKTRQAANR